MKPDLTVVIPCLNEAESLPRLLAQISSQIGIAHSVIVADAGSTDGSCDLALSKGAHVVRCGHRGRGLQMNAGAREAQTEWLLFLHADSQLDDQHLLANALQAIRMQKSTLGHGRLAGHFSLAFVRSQPDHAMTWRYLEEKTAFNRPYCTNGDQGLLLSREYFFSLGGFDEDLPMLEDQRLAERVRSSGVMITLPGRLRTSARRFEQSGLHTQYLLMALIMSMHAADMRRFFQQAPGLYRAQHELGQIRLMPYFRLAQACARSVGRWRTWLSIGRLGRDNWWQLFYFLDILLRPMLGPGRYPCLRTYERIIEPLTHNRPCEWLAAIVLWLHFHAVVLPWSCWQDRRQG